MTDPGSLRQLVDEAYERGLTLDLAAAVYGPDTGSDRGYVDRTMSYYPLLAGVVAHTGARTVVEVGTHFGGSTLALLAGLRAARGDDPRLVTMDVTDLNRERLDAEPEIVKVIGDSTEAGFIESLAAELPSGRRVDLLYIDALKDAAFVLTTLHNVHRAGLRPRHVILDDISANESMRSLWDLISAEEPGATHLISADRPDIRDPRYGYAIIDLDATDDLAARVPMLLAALGLDAAGLDVTAPGQRHEAVRHLAPSRYSARCPDAPSAGVSGGVLDVVHELAREHLAPGADVVTFGAGGVVARAAAEGLAANEQINDPRRRLHSYRGPAGETRDDFHAAVGPRSELVNVIDIDLNLAGWCGRPIALAVADGVSTPRALARLLESFGPSMMVGSSLLVSTDFLAPYRGFQAYVMASLADYFEPLAQAASGVVFGYRRAVPQAAITRIIENRIDPVERVDLVHAQAGGLDERLQGGFLAHAARLAVQSGDTGRARGILAEIEALPAPDTTTGRTRLAQLRDAVLTEGSIA